VKDSAQLMAKLAVMAQVGAPRAKAKAKQEDGLRYFHTNGL